MSDIGCRHFQSYLKEHGLDIYRVVDACYAACINEEARERKAATGGCFECGSNGIQMYACLHCIYFGCRGAHILSHLRAKKHSIALELSHGTLYCNSCRDFIYDSRCFEIAMINRRLEAKDLQKAISYQPWIPSPKETNLLISNPRRRFVRANETIGLRGLINLGSTCFMNCIVQTLIHTPLLSDYFLSERHECSGKAALKCLVCEISRLFQEFYSGSRTPLSLHRLLHLIWNHAKHLAGYEQQDAHEFFIATLDVLHRHCLKAKNDNESVNINSNTKNNNNNNTTNSNQTNTNGSTTGGSGSGGGSGNGNGNGNGSGNGNGNGNGNLSGTGNGNGNGSNIAASTGTPSSISPLSFISSSSSNSSTNGTNSCSGTNNNSNSNNNNSNNNVASNGSSSNNGTFDGAVPSAGTGSVSSSLLPSPGTLSPIAINPASNSPPTATTTAATSTAAVENSNNQLVNNLNSALSSSSNSSTSSSTSSSSTASSSSSSTSTAASTVSSIVQCNCIIDQIFTGMLQSDVVCQACKNVSTTIDPFWDISLDLGETSLGGSMPKTLIDCLERYTRAEHLGSSAKIKCSTCKSYQESTKQFSLRTLPSVASFHLKRFEHSSLIDKKISTFISFPLEFDMTPFMSDKNNAYGDFRYSLYAVVNHVGTIDSGHYTAFVRHHKDTWVKCDDHIITSATLKQVLDSEGYLLFYHKNILEYE